MAKYLDYNGLSTVWNKIKQTFATQVALNNAVNDINTLQTNYNTITANLTPALVNQYLLNVKDMLVDNIKPSDINSVAKWFKTYDVENLDIDTLKANSAYISELKADEITSDVIKSTAAYINYLTTNAIKASDIVTAHAQIQNLDATYAKVQDLTAATARIGNLETDNATINGTLTAQAADITTLKADSARIDSIEADNITIKDSFTAINGKIDTLEADNVTINETLTANKATIDDLTANKASISDLEAATGRITTLESDNVTINDTLKAQNADITNLKADKADITDLTAATGRIDTLESDNVTINETLTANKASIDDLTANKASIEDLNATNANVTNLTTDMANVDKLLTAHSAVIDNLDTNYLHADVANITEAGIENLKSNLITANNIVTATLSASQAQVGDLQALLIKSDKIVASLADLTEADVKVLFADNAFVQNLQSVSSTTAKSVIDSAYISDIVANNISVADLKAGDITLSDSMRILSENGAMVMNGTALQISGKDKNGNTYVGVQLGYDAKNEPSLILKNSAGATVLTPSGITKDAVADGLIVNDMISNSTIQKEKLGFQIVDTDENGNISITNVLDGSGNNFGVEYTNFVKDTNDSLSTLTSSISGVETKVNNTDKKITDKVWQTDIETAIDDYNKDTVTGIASRVTATETDLSGIHTTISDIQTDVSKKADSSDITTLTERIATAESDVSGFKTTVQQTYATKDENTANLESAKAYAEAQVDGIVIGGRNLILNSDFHNEFMNWATGSNAVSYSIKTDSEYGTYLAFTCNGTGNTSANRVYQSVFDGGGNHVAGATYTLSFDAKLSKDGYFNAGWDGGLHQFSGTTAWQHFEHTYIVTGTGSFTMFPNAADTTLSITHIMLERSTKSSNWVLALGDQDAAISSVRTYAEQLADRFYWIVESNSSKTSLTMTDAMLEAITTQFVVKDPSGTATVISGGNIQSNSITANMLATDAIKSNNYRASSNTDSHYSALGTYLDLSNGNFYTQNFGVDNINGKAYLNGEIIATSGRIGSNAVTNYWELGTKTDYNGRASAALIGHGTSYIQSGGWQISNNRINTQSYDTDNSITYLYDGNTYYDFGMKVPEVNKNASGYINGISNNWLYIRKHANTIPTLEEEWNYIFRVDETGMIYINGKSLDQMYASIDSVTSAYLPTSGGTINGDLTVTGTFTATVSEASKVSNKLTINGTEYDGSSPIDVGVIDIAHGGTGVNSWVANRILFASDTTALSQLPAGESGQLLMSNGTDAPSWISQSSIVAGSATKATQDGDGNVISDTYLKLDGGSLTGNLSTIGTISAVSGFIGNVTGNISGNAETANKVNKTLKIKLNNGETENTNLFTFDGSVAKEINITPSSIGANVSSAISDRVNITKGADLGWTNTSDSDKLITLNTIAFWNGRYNSAKSNIEYVKQGKLGDIVTHDVDEFLGASDSAVSASKFDSAREIKLTGDVTGSASSDGLNGWSIATTVANNSHSHVPSNILANTNGYTAGGLDLIAGAYVTTAASNKSFGLPADAITIEYSTDGGSTWTDYGATDAQKENLFNEKRNNFYLGRGSVSASAPNTNMQLRITIVATDRCVSFHGMYTWFSSGTGNSCTVTLAYATKGDPNTFHDIFADRTIAGNSGPNIHYFPNRTFGGGATQTGNTDRYRITYKYTKCTTNNSHASVSDIRFFGASVWSSPGSGTAIYNMLHGNRLYSWDASYNATFPAQITATQFNGKATSASKWASAITLTVGNTGKSLDGSTSVSYSKSEISGVAKPAQNDTTVTANAGWMSGSDKYKLDSITVTSGGSIATKNITVERGLSDTSTTEGVYIIGHDNSITAGTISGTATSTLGNGGTFNIPSITYDDYGHISSTTTTAVTIPTYTPAFDKTNRKFTWKVNNATATDIFKVSDLGLAKSDIGLGNVDNTSDADKPISTATQTALDSKADKDRGIEFIRGTWTATSGTWTGVTTDSELYDGKKIILYLPYAGSGNATLNLTLSDGGTTGAKNCYYSSTSRLTTHYGQHACVGLIYHKSHNINGTNYEGWWVMWDRDTTVNYQLRNGSSLFVTEDIVANSIIVGTSAGYKKAVEGVTFDIDYPIFWCNQKRNANTQNGAENYVVISDKSIASHISGVTGVAKSELYLTVTLSGSIATVVSPVLTCTKPTAESNVVYIPIGICYSDTYFDFNSIGNRRFQYINGAFQEITGAASYATTADSSINATKIRTYNSRQTTANTLYGDGYLRYFLATSSMNKGKPIFNGSAGDASILSLAWDNTGGFDSQIAQKNNNGTLAVRAMNSGTWCNWRTVLDTGNYSNYALSLNGGTITGQISKDGGNTSFIRGRDTAVIKIPSYNGYSAILSQKTTDGAWEFGTYTNNSAYLTYTPDDNYSSNTNSGFTQIRFGNDSSVTASKFIGALTGTASGNLPLTGGTVTGTLILSKSTDASGVANKSPALIVGGIDSQHLEIDANEIMSKTNGTAVAALYINNNGGLVSIGSGGLKIHNSIATSGSLNIGSNTNNNITFDSGVKLEYSSATKALNFVFA